MDKDAPTIEARFVVAQTGDVEPGASRNGSSASWTREMPVVCNFATRSEGAVGCGDHEQMAIRPVGMEEFMEWCCFRDQ